MLSLGIKGLSMDAVREHFRARGVLACTILCSCCYCRTTRLSETSSFVVLQTELWLSYSSKVMPILSQYYRASLKMPNRDHE